MKPDDQTQSMETDAIDNATATVLAQDVQSSNETAMAAMSHEPTDVIHVDDSSNGFIPASDQQHAPKQYKLHSEKQAKEKG